MLLTVVICTYRRPECLETTLATLAAQTASRQEYTVLIVDNADSAITREQAQRYGYGYVVEARTGLSHARNRGWQEAQTPWVLYLDDDIKAPKELLAAFLERLHTAAYAALGGHYTHWFIQPPPAWLRKYYGPEGRKLMETEELSELPVGSYLSGGIMAVRRNVLEEIGGYGSELGMQGSKMGHGEEDHLQDRMRQRGYRIYYDPALTMEHLVQPYKYTLSTQVRQAYSYGRATAALSHDSPLTLGRLWYRWLQITVVSLPLNLLRLLAKPGYVWQHTLLDTVNKYAYAYGRYIGPPSKPSDS